MFILLVSSSACQDSSYKNERQKGEYITRLHGETTYIPPLTLQEKKPYFWEKYKEENGIAEITKDYFRCNGNSLNPTKSEMIRGEVVKHHDCGGSCRHSLPLINGKEGVYPVLIDLLNQIQRKTGHRVIITSGHRCPEHNTYIDSSPQNQYSKHQIGAEVDFYVQGFENKPLAILDLILNTYKDHPQKEYAEFKRYDKDTLLSTQPWMNKEIFIKLYKANEGRNDDNRHPYPYLSIQVRHDPSTDKRVAYSWEQAFGNYLRY
jgi:hypothetical protein